MNTKNQTLAIALCLAVTSIQFLSCKKDAAKTEVAKNIELVQNVIDTTHLDSGLIAWYTFNGDVHDHSGNHNGVVFNNAQAVAGKAGVPKTAYLFNGIDNYMLINDSYLFNTNRVSIYVLFKPKGFYSGSCHYNTLLSKGQNFYANGRYYLGYTDQLYYNYNGCDEPVQSKFENLIANYGDGATSEAGFVDSNNFVNLNQWYSEVYTYNGLISKFYVNGVLVGKNNTITQFNRNTDPLFIGKTQNASYPYYFNGVIDEIRIYKRALTSAEVRGLYRLENNQ